MSNIQTFPIEDWALTTIEKNVLPEELLICLRIFGENFWFNVFDIDRYITNFGDTGLATKNGTHILTKSQKNRIKTKMLQLKNDGCVFDEMAIFSTTAPETKKRPLNLKAQNPFLAKIDAILREKQMHQPV